MGFRARMFNSDLRACMALRDKRAAENAAARARCLSNESLRETLQAEAERRGRREIDWVNYFRELDINYP